MVATKHELVIDDYVRMGWRRDCFSAFFKARLFSLGVGLPEGVNVPPERVLSKTEIFNMSGRKIRQYIESMQEFYASVEDVDMDCVSECFESYGIPYQAKRGIGNMPSVVVPFNKVLPDVWKYTVIDGPAGRGGFVEIMEVADSHVISKEKMGTYWVLYDFVANEHNLYCALYEHHCVSDSVLTHIEMYA